MSLKSLLVSCLPHTANVDKLVRNLTAHKINYELILHSTEKILRQTLCNAGIQKKYRGKIVARVKKLQSEMYKDDLHSLKSSSSNKEIKKQNQFKSKRMKNSKLIINKKPKLRVISSITNDSDNGIIGSEWSDIESTIACKLRKASSNVANIQKKISNIKLSNVNLTQIIEYQYDILVEKLLDRKVNLLYSVAQHAQKQMSEMASYLSRAKNTEKFLTEQENEIQFILRNDNFNDKIKRKKIRAAQKRHKRNLSLISSITQEKNELKPKCSILNLMYFFDIPAFQSYITNMDKLKTVSGTMCEPNGMKCRTLKKKYSLSSYSSLSLENLNEESEELTMKDPNILLSDNEEDAVLMNRSELLKVTISPPISSRKYTSKNSNVFFPYVDPNSDRYRVYSYDSEDGIFPLPSSNSFLSVATSDKKQIIHQISHRISFSNEISEIEYNDILPPPIFENVESSDVIL